MDAEIEGGQQGFSLGWRIFHFFFYFLGGSTFIAGSVCYYPQFNTPEFDGYYWGAVLYTLGSCGFFLVDVQEWITFGRACGLLPPLTEPDFESGPSESTPLIGTGLDPGSGYRWFFDDVSFWLNCTLSLFGSILYLVGSIGFLPYLDIPNVGIMGFIFGSTFIWVVGSASALIGAILMINTEGKADRYFLSPKSFYFSSSTQPFNRCSTPTRSLSPRFALLRSAPLFQSQGWKVLRIATINLDNPSSRIWKLSNFSFEHYTLLIVEFFAGLGGFCFFCSTIAYWLLLPETSNYVTHVWVMGSCCFTTSSLTVAFRHFVMGI